MPIYSFKCECGFAFDELVSMKDRKTHPCPSCAAAAQQTLTPFRIDYLKMGTDPAFETASSKWDLLHKRQAVKESKSLKENGDYGNVSPGG